MMSKGAGHRGSVKEDYEGGWHMEEAGRREEQIASAKSDRGK